MTHLERFKAVVHFDQPDYVPIFGFRGAGFAHGAFRTVYRRLVETGMPSWVGGQYEGGKPALDTEGWQRYWGTTMPLYLNFFPAAPPQGFEREVHTEGEYEIVESETGAVSRQVPDNEGSYGMPEFLEYDVRDRKSWEFYRQNDLFELRERFPRFVFMGWLEKEVVNEGNEDLIEEEIMSKVPRLLAKGGYFPTVDHSIQPLVTFENMCRFMTLLHDVTGNPEGEFPRMSLP